MLPINIVTLRVVDFAISGGAFFFFIRLKKVFSNIGSYKFHLKFFGWLGKVSFFFVSCYRFCGFYEESSFPYIIFI